MNPLDSLLQECSDIIRKHTPNPSARFDFDSKLYREGIRGDLSLVKTLLPAGSKVLDIGCGKGQMTVLLSKLGFSAYGIDLEETPGEQLGISGNRWQQPIWKEFETKFGNLEYRFYEREIPFEQGYFDFIVAYATIEHVQDELLETLLTEIGRVLKPGGFFFIFKCPRKYSWSEWAARFLGCPSHERLSCEREMSQLLESCGFSIIRVERTDLFPSFPPQRLQNLWNLLFPLYWPLEKALCRTSLSLFCHHMRIVVKRIEDEFIG